MNPIVDSPPADARRVFSPRRRALAAVVLSVIVVHVLLLQPGAKDSPGPAGTTAAADRAAPATVLRVTASPALSSLRPPSAAPANEPDGVPAVAPTADSGPAARPAARPAPSVTDLEAPASAGTTPVVSPPVVAPLTGAAPTEALSTEAPSTGAPSPSAPTTAPPVPLYPTRLPPPTVRAYRLQQGLLAGDAEWRWQPAGPAPGSAYEAQLLGRVGGLTLLDWRSSGRVDAAGVAPERLVVRRRGRGAQATNFQREALGPDGGRGKVSFSASTAELPLVPGAQDRLSWMVQLPAVIAADPARWSVPGREIVLWVVGTRGDAEVWTFDVIGPEPVALADGRAVPALKLVREPRRAYDTQAEVWLDPSQHHLPLRARLRPTGNGEPLELLWRGAAAAGSSGPLPTISP